MLSLANGPLLLGVIEQSVVFPNVVAPFEEMTPYVTQDLTFPIIVKCNLYFSAYPPSPPPPPPLVTCLKTFFVVTEVPGG